MTITSAVTTKLDAVNVLLGSIGESPVNQLDSGFERADIAENVIEEVSRSVQLVGWNWNTEEKYPLKVNSSDEIVLPTNLLKLDAQNKKYLVRGSKLYDKVAHSYKFSADISATVVLFLQFDELPEVARQYIMYRAGRVYQGRVVGSTVLHQFTKEEEGYAFSQLKAHEQETGNYNIFHNKELALMLDRSSSRSFVDVYPGLNHGVITDV